MVGVINDEADNRLSIPQVSGSIARYTGDDRWKEELVRVLIVEDDSELGKRMVASLVRHGFTCEWVQSAEDAEDFAFDGFAVLIVDLGLPGIGGIELIRRLRQRRLVAPILIFTARSSWQEKVEGLNAGADDFLVKPVRIEELVARLHALARRAAGQADARLVAGNLALDPAQRQAYLDNAPLALTGTEYRLLSLFFYNPGRTLPQAMILDHMYPLQTDRDLNTVEVHIGRLRRKIGRARIQTVRGLGYRLTP